MIKHEGRTVQQMAIGPRQAKEWLNTVNTHNRNILEASVRKYTKAMVEGRWRPLVGEPICFAEDGTMLNGANRMTAVVESGTTQVFLVVEGLPMEDQDVMDSGSSRKPGQQLTIHGWKNGPRAAAVAATLLKWHTGTLLSGIYRPDTDEINRFARKYPDRLDASTVVAMRVRRAVPLLPRVVGALHFTAMDSALIETEPSLRDQAVRFIDHFFGKLESGADLAAGHPILTLRSFAVARKLKAHPGGGPRGAVLPVSGVAGGAGQPKAGAPPTAPRRPHHREPPDHRLRETR